MFGNQKFRKEMNLAAVNSINWARIVAQIVYYFYAARPLVHPQTRSALSFRQEISVISMRAMRQKDGLPIQDLIIATNQNDILFQALGTGRYQIAAVRASISPSMDIQVSSNFERVLFEAGKRNSEAIVRKMKDLQNGGFTIGIAELEHLREHFKAGRSSEDDTKRTLKNTFLSTGQTVCPHTAVGVKVARELKSGASEAVITLATAHPAKFPHAVKDACGVKPQLPERLNARLKGPERIFKAANSLDDLQELIRDRTSI